MSDVVERYLLLDLRLGRHVDGLVDAYYGPEELANEASAGDPADPSELVAEADALAALVDVDSWLGDQLRGLRTYAGVLAGEERSYADEVEGCFGVRPAHVPEERFAVAHEQLQHLLPGDGPLVERYEAWRGRQCVPPERVDSALVAVVRELRARTARAFGLPAGEDILVEAVRDEPWLAFNYYLGALRSRIAVNLDLPIAGPELVELAAHETYPGHHTEHAWKEALLVREQRRLEESIMLVPTPQATVSEGIAEAALEVLGAHAFPALVEVLAREGVAVDAAEASAINAAREPLRWVGVNVALMLHEEAASVDDARAYCERWGLAASHYAAKLVTFVRDPTWRAYVITYPAGRALCRSFVDGDPARFRRLLTEQIRVRDLNKAAGGGAAASSSP